jgi:hypothetical protein
MMGYLTCPVCSLTVPEPPPRSPGPRTCVRCRLVRGSRIVLERVDELPRLKRGSTPQSRQSGRTE